MKMRLIFYSIILSLTFLGVSCNSFFQDEDEEYCNDYDYYDCDTEEPSSTEIHFKFNDDNGFFPIPVKVYEGNYEDNHILKEMEVDEPNVYLYLPVDVTYTCTAKYISGSDTIMVLNSISPKKSSETKCDSTCWTVSDTQIDMRLKLY